jgi:hypothetical protein
MLTMKTIDMSVEGDPDPAIRAGDVIRLVPIMGESGSVAAYEVINDLTGETVMIVPASAVVKASQDPDDDGDAFLANGGDVESGTVGDAETFLTDEEEIELLRALGYDV